MMKTKVEPLKKTTVRLNANLITAARFVALKEGLTMRDVVEMALDAYLRPRAKKARLA